jgi:D-alanine-D-alanine ligase
MRIGLAYDLKDDIEAGRDIPEDALEEYDSSAVIDAIAGALRALGHSAVRLGGGLQFLRKIQRVRVDFVFNIAEGRGRYRSREAQVPAILEMLNIPYSGSDPLTLAVTLDKPLAKQLARAAGVATPAWKLIGSPRDLKALKNADIPLPAFVKPAFEGSSKGIRISSKAGTSAEVRRLAGRLLSDYRQPVLIEQYIAGEEITVGVTGNSPARVLGIMHVVPKKRTGDFVYSLEVKRDYLKLVEYECPARFSSRILKRITASALSAYRALGCRDVSRVDFRLGNDGIPYFLEVNPLPGLNPVSGDLPIMSGKMGITYNGLIEKIVTAALRRYGSGA